MLTKAQAKYIQNLGHKKLREDENLFIAEGPKLVLELLQETSVALHSIYAIESFAASHTHIKNIVEISQDDLNRISFLTTPNQVIAIFQKPQFPKIASLRGCVSLMLDTIQDPGNLGSIVRTADWFGVGNIICSKDTADIFNPKVVQATMGSIARVRMVYEDLGTFIHENDLPPLYITALTGKSIHEIKPLEEGIILIGNESKGVSSELLNYAHTLITIPKKGKAESLNAAVATGIVLSALIE